MSIPSQIYFLVISVSADGVIHIFVNTNTLLLPEVELDSSLQNQDAIVNAALSKFFTKFNYYPDIIREA